MVGFFVFSSRTISVVLNLGDTLELDRFLMTMPRPLLRPVGPASLREGLIFGSPQVTPMAALVEGALSISHVAHSRPSISHHSSA